jgi:hypothetical protein
MNRWQKKCYKKLLFFLILSFVAHPIIGDTDLDSAIADFDALDSTSSTNSSSASSASQTLSSLDSSNKLETDSVSSASSPDDLSFDNLIIPTDDTLPETISSSQEIGLAMDLPIIGTVNLIPFTEKDPKTKEEVSGLKVYVPNKGKKLTIGPLTLDEGTLSLINNEPRYSARATLFEKSATLSIKKATQEKKESKQTETSKNASENTLEDSKGPTTKKLPSFSSIVLGVAFDKTPTLEIIPGKKATITNVDIVLAKKQPVQVVATTTILGQTAQVTFSISKKRTDVWLEFKDPIAFDSIIPQLQDTPAAAIQVTSCIFKIKNFISQDKEPAIYSITGDADVSKVPGIESEKPQKVSLKGLYTKKNALFLLKSKEISIPGAGTVRDAKLVITSKQDQKTNKKTTKLKLFGTINIKIPNIGTFDASLNAAINKKGLTFSSKIEQTARFRDINITNITLSFSTEKKSVTLSGDAQIEGYTSRISLMRDAKGSISAQAELLDKEIKPFSKTRTPVIEDISFKDPRFVFEKKGTEYEVLMKGTVALFAGVPMDSQLNFKKTKDGKSVVLVQASAPKDWKLSNGIPKMKGTLFDDIKLDELTFIVSSDEYLDTEKQITYKKGMNFISKTTLSGPLVPVATFTNTDKTSAIEISGYIAPEPLDSVFRASIPTGVTIKSNAAELGKLVLEIAGNPAPTFSLLTILKIKPSPMDDPLILTSRIGFKSEPLEVTLAGTMQGAWKKPMGINGFEIDNVAAEISFGPAFPETGVPAGLGLAGQMGLGSRTVAMALKIPLGGDLDTVLCGALDKLTLNDITDIFIQLAGKVSGKKLKTDILPDDLRLEDIKMYIAPKATTIGEIAFDKGFTMRGIIVLPGFKAFGNLTLSSSGIIAQASCTEIKFGPKDAPLLLVSRSEKDPSAKNPFEKKKTKACSTELAWLTNTNLAILVDTQDSFDDLISQAPTADSLDKEQKESLEKAGTAKAACAPDSKMLEEYNGPTMHLVLNIDQDLSKQGILVSGLFEVANIFKEEAYFSLDKNGLEFDFETSLGKQAYQGKPLLQTCINGKSSGPITNPNFSIVLDFQQYLLSYVKDETKKAINKAKNDIRAGIAGAKEQVSSTLNKASEDAKKKIKDAQDKVDEAQKALDAINKKIDDLKQTFEDAKKNAQKTRDDLDQEIKDLEKQIREKQRLCD